MCAWCIIISHDIESNVITVRFICFRLLLEHSRGFLRRDAHFGFVATLFSPWHLFTLRYAHDPNCRGVNVYATSKNFAIHSKIRICMDVRDHQRKTVSEIKKVHEMCSLKWKFCTMVEGERKRKENGNKNWRVEEGSVSHMRFERTWYHVWFDDVVGHVSRNLRVIARGRRFLRTRQRYT